MKKYDIYGVGGALVDTEAEVSDEFLVEANIQKGVMTLVDEVRQRELLELLKIEDVKLVRKCGGSACNSLVAAASLGAKTFFSGKVADDSDGDLYVRDLERSGVGFPISAFKPGITGKCLVLVTRDAERTMNTFLGASETFSENEIDRLSLKHSRWLFVEGYLVTEEMRMRVIKETIKFAKSSGVKIAISLSDPFVASLHREALIEVIGSGIDLIFCNKEEAFAFTNTDKLDAAVDGLKQFTGTFAITDGANGSITFDGDVLMRSKGVNSCAIDTNGAGDMFAGAFLYAINANKSYAWAAKLANFCASKVVAQFGPRLEPSQFISIKKVFDI